MKAEFAWPGGDRPGGAVAQDMQSHQANRILDLLWGDWRCGVENFRMVTPANGVIGRFRLDRREASYFVRVTHRLGEGDLERRLLSELLDQGCNVNPILDQRVVKGCDGESVRIDIRPFSAGCHWDGSTQSLESLGRSLAELHRQLRQVSMASEVSELSNKRGRRLDEACQKLQHGLSTGQALNHSGQEWFHTNSDWLRDQFRGFSVRRLMRAEDAQIVHGELHRANVMFMACDPLFLDWEEAVHLYVSPGWDIAYVIQRFCADASNQVRADRIGSLCRGYGQLPESTRQMLRDIGRVSLLIVADLEWFSGFQTPISELNKFKHLIESSNAYEI